MCPEPVGMCPELVEGGDICAPESNDMCLSLSKAEIYAPLSLMTCALSPLTCALSLSKGTFRLFD
jgi:hypothetical protein